MPKPRTYWETFESKYQHGEQRHRIYLLDLLKRSGVESILDVGCGTGPIWEMIRDSKERGEKKWDFTYFGVDYSWAMIKVARKEFPEIAWGVQDARNLDENDNSWDCVLLMHCLDHLDDYESAIREASRVAKKYVCVVLWRAFINGPENKLNPRNMYGKEEGEDPWEDTYLQEYSKERLEKAFERNNLEIERVAEGEIINEPNRYNFLYLLRKK